MPSGTALAELSLEQQVASCARVKDRIDRLICYDDMAKRIGFIPADAAEREEEVLEEYGFWEVAKKKNAAGEEIIYLKNDSVEEVITKTGLQRNPMLVIRCKSGQTDVYLDWKSILTKQNIASFKTMPIMVQFGSEAKNLENWELSTDRQALFVPDPIAFVKKMRQHDKMIFRVTPLHDRAQTIVHDISGLNVVLELLVSQCYN